MYTITLANGERISNLEKNGDNFVSKTHIDNGIFTGNLSSMTVSDGKTEMIYHNVELIQQVQYGKEWYLAFRELTAQELKSIELDSKIEYIAMMTNVEMGV